MSGVWRFAGKRTDRDGREARIDPVCHTLVGAALARTGLSKRTALGATALIVGANLSDLDVLAYFAGPAADLQWRRGWTHGVLALGILPFLLTGCLLALHRASSGRRPWAEPSLMVPRQLLLLSFIAIMSHPILDTLNTYGMRWLMPFSGKWFYGDILFIVDPWVWLVLSLGVYYSVRRGRARRANPTRPAKVALTLAGIYAAGMALSGQAVSRIVSREVGGSSIPAQRVMAGPVLLDPLVREFVLEQEGQYLAGRFRWLERPHVNLAEVQAFPRGRPSHPAVLAAAETPVGRRFLGWARFPTFEIQQLGKGRFMVNIMDVRYARRVGARFGTISIPVTLPTASSP